jgi:hypothetical protein
MQAPGSDAPELENEGVGSASLAGKLDVSEHTLANWLTREPGRLTAATTPDGERSVSEPNRNSAIKNVAPHGRGWEIRMTKFSLNADQFRTMEIIEALGFGVIEGLVIRGGLPCYEPEPVIFQTIKLGLTSDRQSDDDRADLKQEFVSLFDQFRRLGDGVVDIEVLHRIPFKLVVSRRYQELL